MSVTLPPIDDNIWPNVQRDTWKYRRRTQPIILVELHATRSGIPGRTPLDEYHATMNWSLSPNNINPRGEDTWASMESFICGGGEVCRVLDDAVWPHYSLGHADPVAYSIEIGQNLASTPFDPDDIEHAARICAWASDRHNIAPRVLPYLSADNHEAYVPDAGGRIGGFVRHDRSANGGYYGKSDPGPLFDDRAFEALVLGFLVEEPEEEEMKPYLVREKDSPYVFIMDGVFYSYLQLMEDADALGIDRQITALPKGTLKRSYVRADTDWMKRL